MDATHVILPLSTVLSIAQYLEKQPFHEVANLLSLMNEGQGVNIDAEEESPEE